MTIKMACLGPPGTGKTTFGMGLVEQWASNGLPTQKIGYFAFTKAAALEAADRVSGGSFDVEDYPFFRTIHSLCFKLMRDSGVTGRAVTSGDMRKFSKESGLEGEYAVQSNEDLADAYQSINLNAKSVWDSCRTAYALSRISARTVGDLDRARVDIAQSVVGKMGWGDTEAYRAFVNQYEVFKKAHGLVDFTDMLEYPIRNLCEVDCQKVIVDEGQDLCPLHFTIIDRLFNDVADELWYVGDDDQAIFGFSGASAEEFLNQIGNCRKVILRQTHRFGQEIVDLSERIVRRVSRRIPKDVIGKPGAETVINEMWTFEPPTGDAFILHRHVAGCREVGNRMINAGVPFVNERGRSPLSNASRLKAFNALNLLADEKRAWLGSVIILVEDLMPSFWVDEETKVKTRFIVHGAKKQIATMPGNVEVTLPDLVGQKILTEEGAIVIRDRKYGMLKHSEDFSYFERLIKNGHELKEGGPTITTIHGSKGREKDRVIVFTEASRKCWQDPDNEHRLAYVAATRTKRVLTICHEHVLDWTPMDYDYPISGGGKKCETVTLEDLFR